MKTPTIFLLLLSLALNCGAQPLRVLYLGTAERTPRMNAHVLMRDLGRHASWFDYVSDPVAATPDFVAKFDLVVLDMVMPGQTLEQTLVALRAVDPRVRVLLVSGDTPNDAIGRLGDGRPLAFLSKPFTREALERAL